MNGFLSSCIQRRMAKFQLTINNEKRTVDFSDYADFADLGRGDATKSLNPTKKLIKTLFLFFSFPGKKKIIV